MDKNTRTVLIVLILVGGLFFAYKEGMLNFSVFSGDNSTINYTKVSGIATFGTNQTSASGTVYIREVGSSSFETVTISNGAFTSALMYESGAQLELQFHATGCYVVEYTATVPAVDPSRDTASIGSFNQYPIAVSMSMSALDQSGTALGTSSDYNYTTSGTTLQLHYLINVDTDDAYYGLPQSYTDWATGDTYRQGFVAIVVDDTDASDFVPASYDDFKQIGSKLYYIYNINTIVDDSDDATDGSYSFSITITINGACDWDTYLHDQFDVDDYNVMNGVTSADASISDIDAVA